MTVTAPVAERSDIPTLDDARLAAEVVLAATPNAQVLLYGSVARGEASEHSDLDLYVLYADIDYAERENIASQLKQAVSTVLNGHTFDLHVSDLPEWEGRVAISNTFEHEIQKDIVPVGGTLNRSEARWDKKQVRPMTLHEEAKQYLDDTLRKQIHKAIRDTSPHPGEKHRLGSPLLGTDADEQNAELEQQTLSEDMRLDRMCDLVSACAMMIEQSLKAAGILQGLHPPSLKRSGHSIEKSLSKLDQPLQDELRSLIEQQELSPENVSTWRVKGTYPEVPPEVNAEADEDIYRYLNAGIAVADRVITEHEKRGATSGKARQALDRLEEARTTGTLRWIDEVDQEALELPPSRSTANLGSDAGNMNVVDDSLLPQNTRLPSHHQQRLWWGRRRRSQSARTAPTDFVQCQHWGKRSKKQCVLGAGHRSWHRYSN